VSGAKPSQALGAGPAVFARKRRYGSLAPLIHFFSLYSLAILLAGLIVLFSLLLPRTFPTEFNFTSILATESVAVLVALAVMVPMAANHFNLSAGFQLGLSVILLVGLQVKSGFAWWEAALVVVGISTALGIANGLLVTEIGIDSFIVTLGSGTILYGISLWYTGGQQIAGMSFPESFIMISTTIGIVPLPAIIALFVAVLLWLVFEYTTVGRFIYAIGANPRAALLVGISTRRYVVLAFTVSALVTMLASLILASQLQVGQPSIGPDYLLPAFAASFFGASSIKPGRVNVWGTVLAVLVLAVVVSGLEQEGFASYVEPLFNGTVLIVAVGIALITTRRRENRPSDPQAALPATRRDTVPDEEALRDTHAP
jgi:ribose transport system permease protein